MTDCSLKGCLCFNDASEVSVPVPTVVLSNVIDVVTLFAAIRTHISAKHYWIIIRLGIVYVRPEARFRLGEGIVHYLAQFNVEDGLNCSLL